MVRQYRKKPVCIEAVQFTRNNWDEVVSFTNKTAHSILIEKYKNNPCKYTKPSIDHIIPKSKGGTNELGNLQFLSWFENRCKNDMTQAEWDMLKNNIKEYIL